MKKIQTTQSELKISIRIFIRARL